MTSPIDIGAGGGDCASTLFEVAPDDKQPTINTDAFARAVEHLLDEHSPITHVPGLISCHEELMRQLSILDGWQQRRRWMYNRKVDEPA